MAQIDNNGNHDQLQQGDVLFKRVNHLPRNAKAVTPTERGYVLAAGETHNHFHVIKDLEHAKTFELNGTLFVEVTEPIQVTHETHQPIELIGGIYEIGHVQEVDHLTKITRFVVD